MGETLPEYRYESDGVHCRHRLLSLLSLARTGAVSLLGELLSDTPATLAAFSGLAIVG